MAINPEAAAGALHHLASPTTALAGEHGALVEAFSGMSSALRSRGLLRGDWLTSFDRVATEPALREPWDRLRAAAGALANRFDGYLAGIPRQATWREHRISVAADAFRTRDQARTIEQAMAALEDGSAGAVRFSTLRAPDHLRGLGAMRHELHRQAWCFTNGVWKVP